MITNNNTGYFIKSCIFEFTDYSKSSSVLYSTSPMINIFNNTFKKCSKNTINYKPANFKEFLLTSNFFSECYVGTIINFDSPKTFSAPLKKFQLTNLPFNSIWETAFKLHLTTSLFAILTSGQNMAESVSRFGQLCLVIRFFLDSALF